MDFYKFVKEIKYQVNGKKYEESKQIGKKMDRMKIKEDIQKCLDKDKDQLTIEFEINISDIGFGFED